MVICCAYGCTNKAFKRCGLSFFRFPLGDPDRLNQWMLKIRRQNWTPKSSSRLCSEHFESDCFSKDLVGRTVLTSTAVPTIFSFTEVETRSVGRPKQVSANENVADEEYSSTVCVNLSVSAKSPLVCDVSCCEDVDCSSSIPVEDAKATMVDHSYTKKKVNVNTSDHSYFLSESPREIKRKVWELEKKYTEARKKINLKVRQTKRLKGKLSLLVK